MVRSRRVQPTDLMLQFFAPVPVGQRVTLRSVERALLTANRTPLGYQATDQPIVRHDETGIVYCLSPIVVWLNGRELTIVPPGGGYRSIGSLQTGRVVACIVGGCGEPVMTRLVVEIDPPSVPYR
jgi:hypothetical protein